MTDLEFEKFEKRLADVEHNIDWLYKRILMIIGTSLVAALVFVVSFLCGIV